MARHEILTSPGWHGIDYLRAFMSLAVIAWHMRLFGISPLFDVNGYATHRIQFSDLINFNLLLLAVPVFFLISIFLQIEKSMKKSADYSFYRHGDDTTCLFSFFKENAGHWSINDACRMCNHQLGDVPCADFKGVIVSNN